MRHVVGVNAPVARGDDRDALSVLHRIIDVVHPFAVERRDVEQVRLSPDGPAAIADPALTLVALGAVDRHATIVAAQAAVDEFVKPVEPGVGASEAALQVHLVPDHLADHLSGLGNGGRAFDLHIAEAVHREGRGPGKFPVGGRDILVGRQGAAETRHIEAVAGVVELLGVLEDDGMPRGAFQGHDDIAGHVLPEIHDVAFPADLAHALGHDAVLDGHIVHRHRTHTALGAAHDVHRTPALVATEAGLVPARHLEPGVIVLAVVLVVAGDGAAAGPGPGSVADDHFLPPVLVRHFQHQLKTRVGDPAQGAGAQGLITAAAQQHGQYVFAVAQQRRDIVGAVIDGLVEEHRRMHEHVRADAGAVDGGVSDAQGGHIELGGSHLAVEAELLAQVAGGQVEGILLELLAFVDAYPFGAQPAGRIPQACGPGGRLAFAGIARRCPDLHRPLIVGLALQRLAAVGHEDGLVGGHLAAVPDLAAVPAADADAIGRLEGLVFLGDDLPGQAGRGAVDPLRILAKFGG